MPANLPAEYLKVEEQYARAKTLRERIELTRELIRLAPKHKGTEKLLRMLKHRLAKLQRELQERERKKVGKSSQSFAIKKEGAAQVVLLGLPNSGKSALLNKLTTAKAAVADYPFTTLEPQPAMMEIEGIQIQLIEAPAIVEGSATGRGLGLKPLSLARTADAIALVVDASQDPVREAKILISELGQIGVRVNCEPPPIRIEDKPAGGIEIHGAHLVRGGEDDLKELLHRHGIFNAVVVIREPVSLQQVEEALRKTTVYKKAFIIVTKCDSPRFQENFIRLASGFSRYFKIIPAMGNPEKIKRDIFRALDLIRVYTKPPDGEPAKRPLVLCKHSTVADVAKSVHGELAEKLKYARVWGSTRFPGQQVSKNYEVQDGDIVELHI